MFSNVMKSLLLLLIIESIILVFAKQSQKDDDSQQTCSKDDEICKNAAKGTADSAAKMSTSEESVADTSEDKTETKSSKKTETKEKPKKSNSKKDKDIADCPLCQYTRPLIKNIMAWIKELLTDPMLIMLYDMFKEKIWEFGHLTKELIGFRLF